MESKAQKSFKEMDIKERISFYKEIYRQLTRIHNHPPSYTEQIYAIAMFVTDDMGQINNMVSHLTELLESETKHTHDKDIEE